MNKHRYKILCVGPQWRGSNAGGLFRALSRIGHLIEIIDENYYLNFNNSRLKVKIADRFFRNWHFQEFNLAILKKAKLFKPEIILVYKGAFVLPETLLKLKSQQLFLINFYPDVSFHTHGSHLPKSLPLYNHIFSTKSFGIEDMKEQLGIEHTTLVKHGFDPEIHRPINTSLITIRDFEADVSFIGGYSPKKEKLLTAIRKNFPEITLKIWGQNWDKANSTLKNAIQYTSITGDLYTLGILGSKINLGLLHEKVSGASSGDQITSRTFHIPGAGGFLMHERTQEALECFEENQEAVFFDGEEELCFKIKHYLSDEKEREKIRSQGLKKAWQVHSLDHRAQTITSVIDTRLKES